MSRALLQQALDALENHAGNYKLTRKEGVVHNAAIAALEAALAQPEPEPVAEVRRVGMASYGRPWHEIYWYDKDVDVPNGTKLYVHGIRPAPEVRRARPDDTEGGEV